MRTSPTPTKLAFWLGKNKKITFKYAVAILSANGVPRHFVAPADNQGLLQQFQDRGVKTEALAYEYGLAPVNGTNRNMSEITPHGFQKVWLIKKRKRRSL